MIFRSVVWCKLSNCSTSDYRLAAAAASPYTLHLIQWIQICRPGKLVRCIELDQHQTTNSYTIPPNRTISLHSSFVSQFTLRYRLYNRLRLSNKCQRFFAICIYCSLQSVIFSIKLIISMHKRTAIGIVQNVYLYTVSHLCSTSDLFLPFCQTKIAHSPTAIIITTLYLSDAVGLPDAETSNHRARERGKDNIFYLI